MQEERWQLVSYARVPDARVPDIGGEVTACFIFNGSWCNSVVRACFICKGSWCKGSWCKGSWCKGSWYRRRGDSLFHIQGFLMQEERWQLVSYARVPDAIVWWGLVSYARVPDARVPDIGGEVTACFIFKGSWCNSVVRACFICKGSWCKGSWYRRRGDSLFHIQGFLMQ